MWRDIERGVNLGITIIGCIVSCTYAGYWLDTWLSTQPLFMMVGIICGAILAFSYLYYFGKGNVRS